MIILRYLLSIIPQLLITVVAFMVAPILALPYFCEPVGREVYLKRWVYWFQTHDNPVNEYYLGGYYRGKWTERYKDNDYLMRLFWLWRNPAYGFSHYLFGYDQRGMRLNRRINWAKNHSNNHSFYKFMAVENERGKNAFMLHTEIKVIGGWYFEAFLGWKLERRDPDRRCMLANRIRIWNKGKRLARELVRKT